MRTPKSKASGDPDFLVPVDTGNLPVVEGDCFGLHWSPADRDCSVCADAELCGIKFRDVVKAKEKQLTKSNGPFLDQVREMTEPELDRVAQIIYDTHEAGEPTSTAEMITYFQKKMRTKDPLVAKQRVIAFVKSRERICTKAGFFYHKDLLDG